MGGNSEDFEQGLKLIGASDEIYLLIWVFLKEDALIWPDFVNEASFYAVFSHVEFSFPSFWVGEDLVSSILVNMVPELLSILFE